MTTRSPTTTARVRQPTAMWVVAFAAMVSFMGIGLVDPILKSIASNLGAGPSQVSLLFTSYLGVMAVAMLITSAVSGRIGGRLTLLLGLGLVVVFAALSGLSGSVPELVGWRAGWGLGNALFIATALAAIVAVTRGGSERAITMYEAALGLGISVGPLLGAVLGSIGWRLPFFGVSLLMAVALLAILLMLRQPVPGPSGVRVSDPVRALSHGGLLLLGISALFYNCGFFAVLAFVPFTLPFGPYAIGGIFFGWGVLLAIFSVWIAPWLRARLGTPAAFGIALGTMTVLLILIALFVSNHHAVVLFTVLCGAPLGVLNTLFTETAMTIAPVPRPVASAGYNFVRFSGGALSPWLCGVLGEHVGLSAPFVFGAVSVLVGTTVLLGPCRRYLTRLDTAV